jgi:hypothetical protein
MQNPIRPISAASFQLPQYICTPSTEFRPTITAGSPYVCRESTISPACAGNTGFSYTDKVFLAESPPLARGKQKICSTPLRLSSQAPHCSPELSLCLFDLLPFYLGDAEL